MVTILVHIDAAGCHCGNCQALGYVDLHGCGKMEDPICGVFNEDLQKTGSADGNAYRCDSCRKAECTTFSRNQFLNEKKEKGPISAIDDGRR